MIRSISENARRVLNDCEGCYCGEGGDCSDNISGAGDSSTRKNL